MHIPGTTTNVPIWRSGVKDAPSAPLLTPSPSPTLNTPLLVIFWPLTFSRVVERVRYGSFERVLEASVMVTEVNHKVE